MAVGVGLEVTANVVKIAILEGGSRGVRLRDFVVRKLDGARKGEEGAAPEADVVSVVRDLLKRHKVPLQNVVASLRCQDAVVREITVPFTRDDQIQKTIKFQAENYFHSVSIDDLIIEYLKFGEGEGKSKLLVAGVRKSLIDRKLRLLEECGVDPVALDLDVAALYNAYADAKVFEKAGVVLIVEIEQDTLKLAVVEDGRLRAARAIRIRTGSIRVSGRSPKESGRQSDSDVGPAQDTHADDSSRLPVVILDDDEAAFSLEDSGISETEREDYLSRIFMEIDRTVGAIRLPRPLDLICLTGASCALDGIEETFAEHFEVKATRVDLGARLGSKEDKKQKGETSVSLQGATAVGLALKAVGVDHTGLDFRKEEFSQQGKLEPFKRGAACTLCLLFAIAFVTAFGYKQDLREKRARLDGVKTVHEALYTILFPSMDGPGPHRDEPVKGDWYQSILYEQRRLSELYGGATNPIRGGTLSALEVLKEFGEAKAKVPAQWGIEVERIRVDPRDDGGSLSTFSCTSPNQQAAIVLEQQFKDSQLVTANSRETRQDPRTQKWVFDVVVKVKPKQGSGS